MHGLHFSKWIEIIPISNKEPETVAYAFLHQVLARFGGCAEVASRWTYAARLRNKGI